MFQNKLHKMLLNTILLLFISPIYSFHIKVKHFTVWLRKVLISAGQKTVVNQILLLTIFPKNNFLFSVENYLQYDFI